MNVVKHSKRLKFPSISSICPNARRDSIGTARSAFTLLETILALSLSALLLGAIYAAIDQSWRTSASGREEMERAQLARAIIHKFEVDIRAITYVPPPPVEDTESSTTTSSSSSSSSSSSGSGGSSGGGSSGGGGGSSSGGSSGGTSKSASSNSSGGGSSKTASSSGGSSGSSKSTSSGSGGGSSGGGGGSGSSSSSGSTTGNAGSSTDSSTETEEPLPNSKSVGVRGTSLKVEMSIARPRRDLLPGTTANPGLRTSDLRQVTYAFVAPGTGSMTGLIRTEGDRMAVEVLESSGGSANQISSVQTLAPEIAAFRARYFDGRIWSDSWDSDTMGRIPRAIEISIAFAPPKRKPSLLSAPFSRTMDSFRTVVLIPVSDPYPKDFLP